METKQNVLVPIDFTKATETALENAVSFANQVDCNIYLLHVLDDLYYAYLAKDAILAQENYYDYKSEINSRMHKLAEQYPNENIAPIVRKGNVFDTISQVASEYNIDLLFLGTHGRNSFWKALASDTLRLVDSTDVPVIITQENNYKNDGYKNILFPIVAGNDPRNKAKETLQIAERFDSNIHFFVKETDMENINNNLEIQTKQVKEYFHKHDKNVISISSKDTSISFEEHLLRYAKTNKIDLILLISDPDKHGMIFGDDFLESIFFNDLKIPVMCVSAITNTRKYFWSWEHFHAY